ncbi:MAG: N-formylglutamate amidohydrolase [Magnetospirillum sp.]|nr:N-formylglutamate amidohydrolase [Magnetospirillum sp.]
MLTFIPDRSTATPPFVSLSGGEDSRVLVICDHASNRIPGGLGDLGLGPEQRDAHIVWDIGAAEVSRRLAARLGCPAVLAGVSRLVIDCNRQPGDPGSIPSVSCGVVVPGNAAVGDTEAERRAEDWFWPYHHEIGRRLAHMWRHGMAPAVVAVHSFTPRLNGQPRPWHVGVLWNRDPRMAVPVLRTLSGRPDLMVGDNQPYSGREINYTLDTHAGAAGLPHISLEIRQDLIDSPAGAEIWATLLAEVLAPVLADSTLHRAVAY